MDLPISGLLQGWVLCGQFDKRSDGWTLQSSWGEDQMMWGCMIWDGVGMACKMDGKMDANLYVQILEDELQQTLVNYGFTPEDIIF